MINFIKDKLSAAIDMLSILKKSSVDPVTVMFFRVEPLLFIYEVTKANFDNGFTEHVILPVLSEGVEIRVGDYLVLNGGETLLGRKFLFALVDFKSTRFQKEGYAVFGIQGRGEIFL